MKRTAKKTKKRAPRVTQEISSGGIVFKKAGHIIRVALIARRDNTVLCLPKGKIEPKETPALTALREVREETNLRAGIVKKLGIIHYRYNRQNTKIYKTVHFFLMRYTSGAIKGQKIETDGAKWHAIDNALSAMTYKGEIAMMRRAKKELLRPA
jgi:8-oxo-dGTP pyrophosphatase MutT (NUDIX family)